MLTSVIYMTKNEHFFLLNKGNNMLISKNMVLKISILIRTFNTYNKKVCKYYSIKHSFDLRELIILTRNYCSSLADSFKLKDYTIMELKY